MNKQTILWTALPKLAQPARNKLVLSVHVAPRLDTGGSDGVLGSFPDFLDWPAKLAQVQLQVDFGGGVVRTPTRVTVPDAASRYWQGLFAATTLVKGRDIKIPDGPIISYPIGRVVDYLKSRYQHILQTSPTEHLPLDQMIALFQDIAFAGDGDEKERRALVNQLDTARDTGFVDPATGLIVKANVFRDGTAPGAKDMLAVERFYTRADFDPEEPIAPPVPDFHQMLAMAGGHPALQRLLGVVIDLELDGFRDSASVPDRVRVLPSWMPAPGANSSDSTPWTMCTISSTTFLPTPLDPGELKRGQLLLGDPSRFSIVQIDPDGAALKNLNSARSAKLGKKMQTDDTPDAATVPSLRTGGIAVARVDHAAQLGKAFARMKKHVEPVMSLAVAATQPEQYLHAEDVTRGYYVDIWDDVSKQWHSLTRRAGKVKFLNVDDVDVPAGDEGAITVVPVTDSGAKATGDMYLGESIFRWLGWSLAADQPGRLINNSDALDDSFVPAAPPFPLVFDLTAAPKSLPRLRFGREYRVRMRAADLAGNSVPEALAAGPEEHDIVASVDFRRFEPVQSPDVVMRHARTEGESNERLVLRSNYKLQPLAAEDRQVVPARTWQRQAEEHGLFDLRLGPGKPAGIDKAWYDRIVAREAISLASLGQLDPNDPLSSGDGVDEGTFFIPQALDVVPYLPDPLTRGAALQGLPGTDGLPYFVDFSPKPGAAWPDYRPFLLRLVEPGAPFQEGPAGAPKLDTQPDGVRVLTVQLPKADVLRVRVSSTLDPADLDRLGMWQWADGAVSVTDASEGRVWLLTPYRLLTLVHAVRQPLRTPEFVGPKIVRGYGTTFANVLDRMTFSRKSTAKVELLGTWREPIDGGPGTPDPQLVTFDRALAITIPVDPSGNDGILVVDHRHEFHDTRHRTVTYTGIATTRFTEYFVERLKLTIGSLPFSVLLDTPSDPDLLGEVPGVVPGATRVKRLDTGALLEEGTQAEVEGPAPTADFWVDSAAQKLHLSDPALTGVAVEVSFVETSITRETVAPRTLSIPSSARPSAPDILYIVPTFRWQQDATSSKRSGGSLRVYLDRPWYSSGDGELLGVVLWPGGIPGKDFVAIDPPTELQGYVSEWAIDPMTAASSLPSRQLKFQHFPLSTAAMQGKGLTIDESILPVDVAGHAVRLADPSDPSVISNFDNERGLYYCDIDIDQGNAYWPFIRLALARYQPASLKDVELSRVILADYAQLAPDRSLSVVPARSFSGLPSYHVTLTGPGFIQTAGRWGYGGARVMIETKNAGKPITSDIAWGQSGPPIQMTPGGGNLTNQVFSATVTLPGAVSAGLYRLVVEQFEQYDQGPGEWAIAQLGEKIVHQDIFPLSPSRLSG